MAAPSLLHQLPTNCNFNRRRLGRKSRLPSVPHRIAFESPTQFGDSLHRSHAIWTGASRRCIHMPFVAMVKPLDAAEEPESHDNSTRRDTSVEPDLDLGIGEGSKENFASIEGNQQANGANFSCNQNFGPLRDGSNLSSTARGSEVAFLHSTGVTSKDDECSGKLPSEPVKEQDFSKASLLDTGTIAAVRSRRLLERKFKNERRKWNSNKSSETPASGHQEKTVWLVNKGKPRLRVKAKRLSVIEEAEISSSIKELMRVEEARDSMRKAFGREPTMGEVSKFVGSDISTMRSSIKRGFYSKNTLLSSSMGLIRSIASEHQGRGIAIEDLVQRHVYTLITRVRRTSKLLSENGGRIPRPDEVAEAIGLSVENLSMVLQASKDPTSLDQPFCRGSYTTCTHLVVDQDAETVTEMIMRELLREEMAKLIGTVSRREAEVLRYRYGFQNGRIMTLDEIGSIFKVSKQRIGQIESSALHKLKQYDDLHSLKHFFYKDSV